MFARRKPNEALDFALKNAIEALPQHQITSAEYAKILNHVDKLHAMQVEETKWNVSPDTVAMIAANLLGILIIVSYEHSHALVTKAISLIPKT